MNITQLLDNAVGLFPGQGSIGPGAGEAWVGSPFWSVVDETSESASVDVSHLLLNAGADEVIRTDNAQLATFALSMMSWRALASTGRVPRWLLGHSLGEFSALVAAGVLSVSDGASLIATRGRAMQAAAEAHSGSMVALMGPSDDADMSLSTVPDVWIANVNGTGQIVVSGTTAGLDNLVANHRELGWKRATPIPVGGAFHSPLMAAAQEALNSALDTVQWFQTPHSLVANVDGEVHNNEADWNDLLRRQLTNPVQFLDATLALPTSIETTVEMPPGNVLTGLTKRIRPFAHQFVIDGPESALGVEL